MNLFFVFTDGIVAVSNWIFSLCGIIPCDDPSGQGISKEQNTQNGTVFPKVQKLTAVGYVRNAQIKKADVGFIDLPSTIDTWANNLKPSDWKRTDDIPSGWATVQPTNKSPLFTSNTFNDCTFPQSGAVASDSGNLVDNLLNLSYPNALKTKTLPDSNDLKSEYLATRVTSIDLRAPTNLRIGMNSEPPTEGAWIPGEANVSQPVLPTFPTLETIKLEGKPGQAATPKKLYLRNFGHDYSRLELRVYPIGQVDTNADLAQALSGTDLRVLYKYNSTTFQRPAINAVTQTKPANSPWSNDLYTARTVKTLIRPDQNTITGSKGETIDIAATCPTQPQAQPYNAKFPIVYSTGLSDAGTDTLDPRDDDAQRQVIWVNLELKCTNNPTASFTAPAAASATVPNSAQTSFTLTNTGETNSFLEWNYVDVTTQPRTSRADALSPESRITVTPVGSSPLKKGDPAVQFNIVGACSSAGSYTGYVNFTYKEYNASGVVIEKISSQALSITCNPPPTPPKPSAIIPSSANTTGGTVNVGQTAINTIGIANNGEPNSSLEWRVISVSDPRVIASGAGNLPAGSSFELRASVDCTSALASQVISAFVTLGFKEYNASGVLEEKTKDVALGFTCKIAVISGLPNSINLTTRVGSLLQKTIDLSNLGIVGSELKYRFYKLSTEDLVLPPDTTDFPSVQSISSISNTFFGDVSQGTLISTASNPQPFQRIVVYYSCLSQISQVAKLNLVFSTGATRADGSAILEQRIIPVFLECTADPGPPPGSSYPSGANIYNVCWYGNGIIAESRTIQIVIKTNSIMFDRYFNGFAIRANRGLVYSDDSGRILYQVPAYVQPPAGATVNQEVALNRVDFEIFFNGFQIPFGLRVKSSNSDLVEGQVACMTF